MGKNKNTSSPMKAAIGFTIANVLQKAVLVISVPILTRLMSTEQYGVYSLYLSWFNIMAIITSLNIYYGVFGKAMLKYQYSRDEYVSSLQGMVSVIAGLFLTVAIIFNKQIGSIMEMPPVLVVMLGIQCFFAPFLQLYMSRQKYEYKCANVIIISVTKVILNLIVSIIVVSFFPSKAEAMIISIVIIEVIFSGSIMIYQYTKGKLFYKREFWSYTLKFNLPLLPHFLSDMVLNQGDRIMIGKMVGGGKVSIYSIAYNIGTLVQMVVNSVIPAIVPWLYEGIEKRNFKQIRKNINYIIGIMMLMIIIVMFFAPEILYIFAPPSYLEAIYIIPSIAASVFFVFIYNLFVNVELYFEKSKNIMLASVCVALANVLLNYIFIKQYGYIAAGYTTLICYILYSMVHFVLYKRLCKTKLNNTSIYDHKFMIICSVIMVVVTIVLDILYSYFIIRYICLFIILLVLFIKRKEVISRLLLLKDMKR